MLSPDDEDRNAVSARFDAILHSMRSSLRLHKELPRISLTRSASDRISARVRLAAPGHVEVEFSAAFLLRMRRAIAGIGATDLQALVALEPDSPGSPRDIDALKRALNSIAEQFVLHHELFHLLGGHLDHHIASSGRRSLAFDEPRIGRRGASKVSVEVLSPQQELALYLELEADNSALQFLAQHCVIGDLVLLLNTPSVPLSEYTGAQRVIAFRLLFAGTWMVLLALQGRASGRTSTRREHPWPAARLMALLSTLMPHFVEGTRIREEQSGERFAVLNDGTAEASKLYMLQVVRQALKFVVAQADGDQVVARFRNPDPARSDLFADVLLDLNAPMFDHPLRTPAGRQLLHLARRRRHYLDLLQPFRYFAEGADP